MIFVVSSQIEKIGHDAESQTLAVRFRPSKKAEPGTQGPLYHYSGVTGEEFRSLMAAESIGSHFGKAIRTTKAYAIIPEPVQAEHDLGGEAGAE